MLPTPPSNPTMAHLQSIRSNKLALQRQWAVIGTQPDGATKAAAQQHVAAQMKRLNQMEQAAMMSMASQGQGQQQQQQSQQQQQQQPGQGPPNGGATNQFTPQGAINGINPMQATLQQQQQPGFQMQDQNLAQQQQQQQSPFPFQSQQPPQTPQQQPPAPPQGQTDGDASQGSGGPMNKRDFIGTVRNFMIQRGTPWPANLSLSFVGPAASNVPGETRTVEMQTLFAAVVNGGGSQRASQMPGFWAVIASRMGLKVAAPDPSQLPTAPDAVPTPSEVPDRLAAFYRDRLGAFEQFWLSRMPQRQASGHSVSAGNSINSPAPGLDTAIDPQLQQGQQQPQQQAPQHQQPQPQPQAQSQQQQQPQQHQQQPGQPQFNQSLSSSNTAASSPGQTPGGQPQTGRMLPNAAAMQAGLQHQMSQLQQLVASGKISPQQARERFLAMQQAMRAAMMKQQQAQQHQQQQQQPPQPQQQPQQMQQTPQQQSQAIAPGMGGPMQGQQSQSGPQPGVAAPFGGMPPQPGQNFGGMVGAQGQPGQGPQQLPQMFSGAPGGPMAPPPAPVAGAGAPAGQMDPNAAAGKGNGVDLAGGAPPQWPAQPAPAKPNGASSTPPKPTAMTPAAKEPKRDKKKRKKNEPETPGPSTPKPASRSGSQTLTGTQPGDALPQPPTVQQRQQLPPQHSPSSATQKTSGNATPAPVGPPPSPGKFKIEYLPLRREVHTYGGWDLNLVDSQLAPATQMRGRPRTIRELGTVDVHAMIMSLRSRIDVEVAYSLNALLILSTGLGAPPGFTFALEPCEDLLDELLDILEESSFGTFKSGVAKDSEGRPPPVEHAAHGVPSRKRKRSLPTYRDWLRAVCEEEAELKLWTRRKATRSHSVAGSSSEIDILDALSTVTDLSTDSAVSTIQTSGVEADHERRTEQNAARALSILTILKNLSIMPPNVPYLNRSPKFLELLAQICQSDAERANLELAADESSGQGNDGPATVFSTAEAFRFRKDVLVIISNLAGESLSLRNRSKQTIRSLFDLMVSFIAEASSVEELEYEGDLADLAAAFPPGTPAQNMPVVQRKVPYHADMALDAFSKMALPDDNRQTIGESVDSEGLLRLADELVHLLPVSEGDYQMLKTEPRLAYVERVAMCLYDLAFLSPPETKLAMRRIPGLPGVIFRLVKRLAKAVPDFSRNPFSVLSRRLVEALRLISDGQDMFGAPPLLGLGFSSGPSGGSHGSGSGIGFGSKGQVGLLLDDEIGVVDMLATSELDPVVIAELHALLALG